MSWPWCESSHQTTGQRTTGWNGQGELVCPLRGQSLESRLAAQPGVRRASQGTESLSRMAQGAALLGESRRGRRLGLVFHLPVGVARSSTQARRGGSVCEGVGSHHLGPVRPASSRVNGSSPSARPAWSDRAPSPQPLTVGSTMESGSRVAKAYRHPVATVARNRQQSNKGLERTRRVGVPAARAVIRVSPCRSTRCSTGFAGDRES